MKNWVGVSWISSLPPVTHAEVQEHSVAFMLLVFITAHRLMWVPSEAARERKRERNKVKQGRSVLLLSDNFSSKKRAKSTRHEENLTTVVSARKLL